MMNKNISRDDIADSINKEFGFSRKECLDIVNDIIEIIIQSLIDESNKKANLNVDWSKFITLVHLH